MPVLALTRDGNAFHATVAKALNDLAEDEAKKRAARSCSECGKYRTHEDLKIIATDDGGTARICHDCLDDKADASGKTLKAAAQVAVARCFREGGRSARRPRRRAESAIPAC
jgi:hypothetical protein